MVKTLISCNTNYREEMLILITLIILTISYIFLRTTVKDIFKIIMSRAVEKHTNIL
jgi:hypothetical protein